MSRLYYLLDWKNLETMYISFVWPTLEYGDTIWRNWTDTQRQQIEQVQKTGRKNCLGATRGTLSGDLLRELGWATMKKRRTLHRLILFHKILNGHSPTIHTTVSQFITACAARANLIVKFFDVSIRRPVNDPKSDVLLLKKTDLCLSRWILLLECHFKNKDLLALCIQ